MSIPVKCQSSYRGLLPARVTGLLALLLMGFGMRLAGQQAPCLNRTLAVTVTTQDYQPVTDLTTANFSARVGREPVKITSVTPAIGARIVIVMDTSGSMIQDDWKLKTGVAAAEALFMSGASGTKFALLTFAEKIEDRVGFSQGPNAVAKSLNQLEVRNWKINTRHPRRTALMDAILGALELLDPPRLGDVIYLVSDGGENAGKVRESQGTARFLAGGVRLFAFVPVTNIAQRLVTPEEAGGPEVLKRLSKESGGGMVAYTPTGAFDTLYKWSVDKGLQNVAGAATMAARAMSQEITEFYRLDFELPNEVDKPTKWRLEATKLMGEKNVHLRVNYPRKLQPCR